MLWFRYRQCTLSCSVLHVFFFSTGWSQVRILVPIGLCGRLIFRVSKKKKKKKNQIRDIFDLFSKTCPIQTSNDTCNACFLLHYFLKTQFWTRNSKFSHFFETLKCSKSGPPLFFGGYGSDLGRNAAMMPIAKVCDGLFTHGSHDHLHVASRYKKTSGVRDFGAYYVFVLVIHLSCYKDLC